MDWFYVDVSDALFSSKSSFVKVDSPVVVEKGLTGEEKDSKWGKSRFRKLKLFISYHQRSEQNVDITSAKQQDYISELHKLN